MLVATFLGCGGDSYGPTGKITGKLTMEGQALPPGHAVSFMQMEKGFLAFGMTDAEGKFEVKSWNDGNMPIGKYDVMIAAPPSSVDPAEDPNLSPEERFEKQQTPTKQPPRISIPARYRETTTSGLQYEIKEGENHFDIDLKAT
jgi:hypothetical protein